MSSPTQHGKVEKIGIYTFLFSFGNHCLKIEMGILHTIHIQIVINKYFLVIIDSNLLH